MLNGAILLGATAIIAYQAILRFRTPVEPHGLLMTAVAGIGLIVNLAIGFGLAVHRHDNHNVRAVLAHVAGDALGAFVVVIGGVAIALTGIAWIDPLLSLVVAAVIVVGVARVLRDASDVLLEAAPPGIDSADVERQIRALAGIDGVHDLHVWTIGSGSHALSAHLLVDPEQLMRSPAILERLRTMVLERYGIGHVTVQLECEHCDPGGIVICGSDGK